MRRNTIIVERPLSVLWSSFLGSARRRAPPLIDFPIAYSSNGGTYGFIGLFNSNICWSNKAFALNLSISAGRRLPKNLLPAICR